MIKAASLLISLVGGDMNPLTLLLKNFVFTKLILVLLHKVRKPGTLTLAVGISALVAVLLMALIYTNKLTLPLPYAAPFSRNRLTEGARA
ncbi:MAG: hypothetical protein AVO34_06000 [Firmicutes bacterium ML8_F2]|nr:MAG: hypothetical protein AVO34_06000 [Firmicutes bacterium ML8_F2]